MKVKAVVLRGLGDYGPGYIEKPLCPDEGILVKVQYCGLCGSDLRILKNGHKNINFPAVIGHEISGIVWETGKYYCGPFSQGDRVAVGSLVYCGRCEFCAAGKYQYCLDLREVAQHWPGGLCEYIALPGHLLLFGNVRKLPESLSGLYAALAEPFSCCINAQEQLDVGINDTVLIIGAGPIGCLHLLLAKARGVRKTIIADINPKRLGLAKKFRPDETIENDESFLQKVKEASSGSGPDVIITANPSPNTQKQAIECARISGRIAFFGGLEDKAQRPLIDTNLIHYNSLKIFGIFGFSPKHFVQALDLMASGKIDAKGLITKVADIEDINSAVQLAVNGDAIKVIIKISGCPDFSTSS
jgi:L-iditol 2-dehydrogenase